MTKPKPPSEPLVYIGEGRWLPGVPARDLSVADLERLTPTDRDALVASGLYAPAEKPKETKE